MAVGRKHIHIILSLQNSFNLTFCSKFIVSTFDIIIYQKLEQKIRIPFRRNLKTFALSYIYN